MNLTITKHNPFLWSQASKPTGPRGMDLSVEMPISAPKPYSKPSAKRVEALIMTELESTAAKNLTS